MSDTWKGKDIAAAQRLVVDGELAALKQSRAFWMLFRALDVFEVDLVQKMPASILDIGCGCGHYGWALEHMYPQNLRYTGTDSSPEMIEQAKDLYPKGMFYVRNFYENFPATFDIVMVSQCIEYLVSPLGALHWLLGKADLVILHKLRLTHGDSVRIEEETYCGRVAKTTLWNADVILRRCSETHDVRIFMWPEGNIMTLALRRMD